MQKQAIDWMNGDDDNNDAVNDNIIAREDGNNNNDGKLGLRKGKNTRISCYCIPLWSNLQTITKEQYSLHFFLS